MAQNARPSSVVPTHTRRRRTSSRAAVALCAVLALFALGLAVRGGQGGQGRAQTALPALSFEPLAREHLHNAYRITAKVLSGAAPEGDESFEDLVALGVKTIISVDGATPDVEAARRHGIRYVHLPIRYDGVEEPDARAIAKAIVELPGPLYVHCHHGKHRSAAAVAVACVMNGQLEPERAESVLTTFGTGENYVGLWKAARDARAIDPKVLADLDVDFVETAVVPPMAEAMVQIDATFERLKLASASSWRTPGTHPDVDPPHEALQLREKLHELGRTDDVRRDRPEEFRRMLADNETAAAALEEVLGRWSRGKGAAGKAGTPPPPEIDVAFKAVGNSCAACHKAYRDQ
jgi:protein tyrosine phosphatase (PTP) superfamily phosphohydrolase (DUF442 family)